MQDAKHAVSFLHCLVDVMIPRKIGLQFYSQVSGGFLYFQCMALECIELIRLQFYWLDSSVSSVYGP